MTKKVSGVAADYSGLLLNAISGVDTTFSLKGVPYALEVDTIYGLKLEAGTSVEYVAAKYTGADNSGNAQFVDAIRGIDKKAPIISDGENFSYNSGTGSSFGADTQVSLTNYPALQEVIFALNEILAFGSGGSGDLLIKGVKTVSANTTLTEEDEDYLIRVITGDSDKTIILPAIGSGTFNIVIQKVDSGTGKAIVAPSGSETINGETGNYTQLDAPGDNTQFVGEGNNWNAILGSLAQPNDIINIHDEGNERIFTRRSGQQLRLPITIPHPHSISFSGQDNDTEPASDVNAGEIGIYEADGTTQIQSGDINRAGVLYIANLQATYGQDAASPGTNLQAEDTQPFLDNIMNGGQVIVSIQRRGETSWVYFVVGSIQRYGTEGYRLNVSASSGSYSTSGTGYSWNVVITPAHPESVHNIVDLDTLGYITQEDIVGKETDRYASYNNALIGSGYSTGDWCLYNQATEPTDDTNAVRQPDIADRNTNGVVVFGQTLRSDRNPNNFVAAPASAATDYKSGDVIYASIWNKPDARLAITLTSGGTLVGTGDAARIWATCTWDEIGDIPASDVVDYGDYFKIAREEPTQTIIGITKAMRDFLPTRELDDSDEISTDTPILLENFKHTDLGDIVTWHDEHHVGTFTTDGLTYTTNSSPPNNNEVNYIQFAGDTTRGVVSYKYPNNVARDRLKAKIVIGRAFTLKVGAATVVGKIASTPANLFGRLSFNLNEVTETGTRTNGATAEIITESNIPARSQLAPVAFTGKAENVDVDAAGFDGNLSTTDNTTQKVAQKFDDFTAEITAETIDGETEAVESDGDIKLLGARGVLQKPVRDASADYDNTDDFEASISFVANSNKYVLATKASSRSLFVKKNNGAFVEKANQLHASNPNVKGLAVSIGGTVKLFATQLNTTTGYVYTFNTGDDTLTFERTLTLNSANNAPTGCTFVNNNGDRVLLVGENASPVYAYDTDATFTTLTYQSSKNITGIQGQFMEVVGDRIYIADHTNNKVKAFNLDRTPLPSADFDDPSAGNEDKSMYADDEHIFINNITDNKFYAYRWKGGLIKKTIPQDEVDLQKKIANTPAAVADDGDVTLIGRKGGAIKPVYDSSANVSYEQSDANIELQFAIGSDIYTAIWNKSNNANMFISKNGGALTTITGAFNVDSGDDVYAAWFGQRADGTTVMVYAVDDVSANTSYIRAKTFVDNGNNTYTLTSTGLNHNAGSGNPVRGITVIKNGDNYEAVWVRSSTSVQLATFNSNFSTLTNKNTFNSGVSNADMITSTPSHIFVGYSGSADIKAFTLAGVADTAFDFTLDSAQARRENLYVLGDYIYSGDWEDDIFYAYKYFIPIGTVTLPTPQKSLVPTTAESVATLTTSYANVGGDYADDDIVAITVKAALNSDSGSVATETIIERFGDMSTSGRWIAIRGGDSGARVDYKRISSTGTKIQMRTHTGNNLLATGATAQVFKIG